MSAGSSGSGQTRARDTIKRSLAKAISWRVVGTLDTFLLSFVIISFLGPLFGMNIGENIENVAQTAGYIAITEVLTKLVIYTLHEQAWTRISWGASEKEREDKEGQPKAKARSESFSRSTAKTASWRILASLDTMLLAWIFTGNILTAVSIGGFEVITKLILYFFHERVWLRIPYGMQQPES